MAKPKQTFIKMRVLVPQCHCGDPMTKFARIHLDEHGQLVFTGTCSRDGCELGMSATDVEEDLKVIRALDVDKLPTADLRPDEDGSGDKSAEKDTRPN